MELTDEQLVVLLQCEIWNIHDWKEPAVSNIDRELLQSLCNTHLLRLGRSKGKASRGIWLLTNRGRRALQEQALQALTLLSAPSFAVETTWPLIKQLSIEELPELLAHQNSRIRWFAKKRIEELKGDKNGI